MKPKTRQEFVPKALREVWEWKAAIHRETQHFSTREMLAYIHEHGGQIARQLRLPVASFPPATTQPVAKVAEATGKYVARRKK